MVEGGIEGVVVCDALGCEVKPLMWTFALVVILEGGIVFSR